MATDPVAWGVDNGLHTPEMYRVAAHIAAQGEVGVLGLLDLKVKPLVVPGAGVLIDPGVGIVPCRAAGMSYQTYLGRIPTQDTAGVTATDGSGGRTDLVVYQIENPVTDAYTPPVDPAVGPYVFPRVHANVGAPGTLPAPVTNKATATAWLAAQGLDAIPLALVVQPLSNGAVSAGMITDLRTVARPKTLRQQAASASGGNVQLTSATFVDWAASATVDVPAWATTVVVTAVVRCRVDRSTASVAGTALGSLRMRLGGTAVAPTQVSQTVAYDELAPFADTAIRTSVEVSDTMPVPASLRGQNGVTLALQGIKASGNKNLYVDTGSFYRIDWEWKEAAA